MSYEKLLFICCGLTFAGYFGSYMRMPVVPLYARSLGADTVLVGMINGAFLLMAGLLSIPLGMLSDRIGRKRLITLGMVGISISALLLALSASPVQMIGISLLMGVSLAAFAPTMMSYVADISPLTHLGRSYGWYTLAVYVGMSLGPAAGGFVAERHGFGTVFLGSAVMAFLVAGMVAVFLPRARDTVLRRPTRRPFGVDARELMGNRQLLACWFVTFGGCVGLGMFVTYVPLHAREEGVSVAGIGMIFAAQGLINALSRIPFGRLSDRVARRSSLVVAGLAGFSASVAGFGASAGLWAFLASAVGLGASMAVAFTAIGALISQVVSPQSRGLAMGGYNSSIYFGMMLGSLLMGPVIREVGFSTGFYLAACFNLLAATVFFLVFHRTPPDQAVPGVNEPKTG
ncbi:MAG: MFS transporter [Syntrophobacteraceae bacterium]|nr:MFS transporter [Syntrophobacteraceae bacterium]